MKLRGCRYIFAYALLLVLGAVVVCNATSSPILAHDDPATEREFVEVYRNINSLQVSSGATVQRWFQTYTQNATNNTTTFADTGLTLTTGVLLSAKDYLVIRFNEPIFSTDQAVCRIKLICGSTTVGTVMGQYTNNNSPDDTDGNTSGAVYRYYPNATTAVTCKTQFSSTTPGVNTGAGGDGTTAYDSTMEIEEVKQ